MGPLHHPERRLPAPDPVRGRCPALVQGLLGKHWKPAKPVGRRTPTLATIPALPGTPPPPDIPALPSPHLSPKPSPRRGSSSRCPASLPEAARGREANSFPRGRGCAVPGTRTSETPSGCGAGSGRLAVLCLWGFVFVLVAVYVNLAVCSSCSSSRSSPAALNGDRSPPPPPSTLRILHLGQSPALWPWGLRAWTAG